MYPTVSLLLALGLFAAGGAGGAIAGAGTAVGAGAAAGAGVPQQGVSGVMVPGGLGPLALSACQLEDPAKVSVVLAECGELSVLENPSDSNGRNLRLHIARVPAINRRKQPDPLFVLAGGPGMAATTFYASAAFPFERIHRDRDIVLVDQRGTGQSNPLNCALDDDDFYLVFEQFKALADRQKVVAEDDLLTLIPSKRTHD